ncbi:MAG: hypothetical protein AAFW01_02800 [Pseudomonadota bacterium]
MLARAQNADKRYPPATLATLHQKGRAKRSESLVKERLLTGISLRISRKDRHLQRKHRFQREPTRAMVAAQRKGSQMAPRKLVMVAMLLSGFTAPAGAVTLDFVFNDAFFSSGAGNTTPSIDTLGTSNNSGVTSIAVTSPLLNFVIEGDEAGTPTNINIANTGGLGVQGNPESGNIGLDESISFLFSPVSGFVITAVRVGLTEDDDEVENFFFNDASVPANQQSIDGSVTPDNTPVEFDATPFVSLTAVTPSLQIIGAAANDPNADLGVRIETLSVDLLEIPLPLSLLLLGSGLAGFAMLRRRERTATL